MNSLTILLIAHNELPYVKIAVDSIRKLGDIESLELIVVDNASSDGLREWAKEQEDFTYVLMDQGIEPYGKIVNEVIRELEPAGDLLVMEAHYVITPGCLSRLQNALYENERLGAVGGMSNSFQYYQRLPETVDTYEKAVNYAVALETDKIKCVLGLCPNVILFKREALEAIGAFEEQVFGGPEVMKDYSFRLIEKDYSLGVCREAVFWDLVGAENYFIYTNRFYRSADEKILEEKWRMHYFNYYYNESLIAFIKEKPGSEINVLEIGCDCGATLLEIKNRFPYANVYGSELNEVAAGIASHVAEVIVHNIENMDLPYKQHMFDYIIFGDVLEHLHHPEKVIEYCKKLLKSDGKIIACIPNVMHISVVEQLLRGNFTYTEMGLLDKTHIHFFTYNEILRMFMKAGFVMEETAMRGGGSITEEQSAMIDRLLALGGGAERFMFEAFQYVIRAKVLQSQEESK